MKEPKRVDDIVSVERHCPSCRAPVSVGDCQCQIDDAGSPRKSAAVKLAEIATLAIALLLVVVACLTIQRLTGF